jgi:hypothetical protein
MVPEALIRKYGQPHSVGSSWITFFHRCPAEAKMGGSKSYAMLCYSVNSGWLNCKACGFKMKSHSGSIALTEARPAPTNVSSSEAMKRLIKEENLVPVVRGTKQWEYLSQRGLTAEEILAAAPLFKVCGWMSRYVLFPIIESGQMVTFHGRDCDPSTHTLPDECRKSGPPRYLSPKSGPGILTKRQCVWGIDRLNYDYPIVLCEGIFDALAFDNGVAYMGPVPSEVQIAKISAKAPPGRLLTYVTAVDAKVDASMVQRAVRAGDTFAQFREPPSLDVFRDKDFGDMLRRGHRWSRKLEGYNALDKVSDELWFLDLYNEQDETDWRDE